MNEAIQTKLEVLPHKPGVYRFLDKTGTILYIGKAINLYNRVRSYFNSDLYDRPRIKQMMPLIVDLEVIETNNEIESLVLESALIKKYNPLYNTDLKDDKSYAWIYISTKDKFPTVKIVRTLNEKEYKKGELKESLHILESYTHSATVAKKIQKNPCITFSAFALAHIKVI